ncbi:hypothetical protein [Ornithinimicrobium kibberense]|uniref:hypothetical protein n=1 Tax=Ornithinimicrobium kibberense TaxID=282060 RepID=UPI00360BEAC4
MGAPAVVFICGGWVAAVRELALSRTLPGVLPVRTRGFSRRCWRARSSWSLAGGRRGTGSRSSLRTEEPSCPFTVPTPRPCPRHRCGSRSASTPRWWPTITCACGRSWATGRCA